MPTLSIKGETIQFPEVNASPNWAPAIVQFANATADALNSINSEFDVTPSTQTLSTFLIPSTTAENLHGLVFPKTTIYSFKFDYYIDCLRNDTVILRESGTVEGFIDSDNNIQLIRSADKDIGAVIDVVQSTGQVTINNPITSGNIFVSATIAFRGTSLSK